MLERMNRASTMIIALFAASACLAACGDSGGGTGGNGGQGTGGSSTTSATGSTTSGTTSSTSSTTTTGAPGCLELCEKLNECPNVAQANCPVDCPPAEAFNATAMCTTEYEAMVACIIVSAAPCQASNNECLTQASEYVSCTSDYCAANPADPGCP